MVDFSLDFSGNATWLAIGVRTNFGGRIHHVASVSAAVTDGFFPLLAQRRHGELCNFGGHGGHQFRTDGLVNFGNGRFTP